MAGWRWLAGWLWYEQWQSRGERSDSIAAASLSHQEAACTLISSQLISHSSHL